MTTAKTLPTLAMTLALFGLACSGSADDAGSQASADQAETPAAAASQEAPTCYVADGTMAEAAERPSPLSSTTITLGGEEALLCYGSPSAKGREIMGGLVPYGELWRGGANEATALHLPFTAQVGGITLEPGDYSIYFLPGADEWEVFINSNAERWGIPIDDAVRADDAGSFKVTPEATEDMVESLTYSWEPTDDHSGHIVMEWEHTRLKIPVEHPAM
ncbi:MAG: DUF2911 domain-containing protein [Gemmatimonadota bacterium]